MKALILKDLYNIGHNSKQMLILLLFFAFIYIPTTGFVSFVVMASFLCSAMIMTTFHFDKTSNWEKYALTLPISKKTYIQSKYLTTSIFCLIGGLFSAIVCVISFSIFKKGDIKDIGFAIGSGIYVGIILGGILIAAIIRFGAENARNVLIVIIAIPFAITLGVHQLMKTNQTVLHLVNDLTKQILKISDIGFALIGIAFFILIVGGTYLYSYRTFAKKEW